MPSCTVCATSANLACSGALEANSRARSSWPAASTLTPKRSVSRTTLSVRAVLSKHTSSSSGSSDSEQTALAVIPTGPSPEVAVTTVTPVAKVPITDRKRSGPTGCRGSVMAAALFRMLCAPDEPLPPNPALDRRGRRCDHRDRVVRIRGHPARLQRPELQGRRDLREPLRRLPYAQC